MSLGRTIAILPARGGSKRLMRKNVCEMFGQPMLAWAVQACKGVDRIESIYVSSEDEEILKTAGDLDCEIVRRPADLAEDQVPKMEVVRHLVNELKETGRCEPDTLVIVQANSPELRAADIDRGLDLMEQHALWEVLSVDSGGVQNAAFRILRAHALYNTFLSAHVGVVTTDYADIHTQEDLEAVIGKYGSKDAFLKYKGGN